jgi:hypothetical protein
MNRALFLLSALVAIPGGGVLAAFVTYWMAFAWDRYVASVSLDTGFGIGLISFVVGALGTAYWMGRDTNNAKHDRQH